MLLIAPTVWSGEADPPPVAVQAADMLQSLRSPEPPTEAAVEDFLVEQYSASAEFCIEALLSESIPAGSSTTAQRLSIQQERILLSALGRMPSRVVRQIGDRDLQSSDDERARVVTCQVYGRIGTAFDVDLLFASACEPEAEETTAALRKAFREGLSFLVRSPDAAIAVQRMWPSAPNALLEPTLQALGDSRDPRVLGLLKDVITWDDEWALLALAQVRLIGPSLDEAFNNELADSISELLDDDSRSREQACLALGELRNEAHFAELIDQLDSTDSVVRGAAHKALMSVACEQLPPNPRVWRVWHERQKAALAQTLEQLSERALSGPPTRVLPLIRGCTQAKLGRHDIAGKLIPALDHSKASVRVTTCQAIQALGSPIAIYALLHALGDPEDAVREAAETALIGITGSSPLDASEDWRDFIEARTGLY